MFLRGSRSFAYTVADWTRARAGDDVVLSWTRVGVVAEEIGKKVLEPRDSEFLCDWMLRFEGLRDELMPLHFHF